MGNSPQYCQKDPSFIPSNELLKYKSLIHKCKFKTLLEIFRGKDVLDHLAFLEVNHKGQFQPLAEEIIWLYSIKEFLNKKIAYIQLCNLKAGAKIKELETALEREKVENRAKIKMLIDTINQYSVEEKSSKKSVHRSQIEQSSKCCQCSGNSAEKSKKPKHLNEFQHAEDDTQIVYFQRPNSLTERDFLDIERRRSVSSHKPTKIHKTVRRNIKNLNGDSKTCQTEDRSYLCGRESGDDTEEDLAPVKSNSNSEIIRIRKHSEKISSSAERLSEEQLEVEVAVKKEDLSNQVARLIMERESLLQAVLNDEERDPLLAEDTMDKQNSMGDAR